MNILSYSIISVFFFYLHQQYQQLVSDSYTVLECFICVNNTAEIFVTSVNDIGKALLHWCQRHR
jgi:hypothetical protein